jgi:Mrp family chromosome partitioning ATPase/capsular polysaccharide biosynthesis protein
MEPNDLLRALAARWRVVAAAVVVAAIAGFATAATAAPVASVRSFQAKAVIVPLGQTPGNVRGGSLDVLSLLTTNGEVPKRVAEATGYKGSPIALASEIDVEPDPKAQSLSITARADTGERAEQVANAFAKALIQYIGERNRTEYDAQLEDSRQRLDEANEALQEAERDEKAAVSDPAVARARRETRARELESAFRILQGLQNQGTPKTEIEILQEAEALPVETRGFRAPSGRLPRTMLAAFLGLLLGVGIAFTLERLDARIHSSEQAAKAFGLPVLAEVPHIPASNRRGQEITTTYAPLSPAAASFRLLATALGSLRADHTNSNGHGPSLKAANGEAPGAVLVTGPMERAGATTVASNLSASFAQAGWAVIALSADLRRPALHEHFDVPGDPGLLQGLRHAGGNTRGYDHQRSNGQGSVDPELIHETSIQGLWVVPSGGVHENPADLLSGTRFAEVLGHLRRMCDIVVIDSPSLLDASDAAQMLPQVDAIVVAARAGQTSVESAKRTGEFLRRVHLPVIGVVLVGSRRLPGQDFGRNLRPLGQGLRKIAELARSARG